MQNSIDQIRQQFNSEKRIEESLQSYGIKPKDGNIEFDPYEKNREEAIIRIIQQMKLSSGARALDIGCGLGTLLNRLYDLGLEASGFDLAEKAIDVAKNQLRSKGHNPESAYVGNLFDIDATNAYDLCIANGVIWYYEDKNDFLKKVYALLKPGGASIIVHRNDLFNIYALNSGTKDFFARNFTEMNLVQTEPFWSGTVFENLKVEKHSSSALNKPYDNPLAIQDAYSKAGLKVLKVSSTYIHPYPPRLLKTNPQPQEVYDSAQLKYENDWRGLFMGSQFIVTAMKGLE